MTAGYPSGPGAFNSHILNKLLWTSSMLTPLLRLVISLLDRFLGLVCLVGLAWVWVFFFSKPMFGATKWVWLKLTSLHFIPSKRDKCNPSKTRVKKIQSTFLSNSSPTLFSLLSPPLSPTP
ncbi:hypothetical protein ACOSQ3_013962 [Xanthoceras sorbifolium]